jgi:hypothetical protein
MKKFKIILYFCIILLINPASLFSQDSQSEPRETREILVSGLIGVGETLLSNLVVMSFNIVYNELTGEFQWARPNQAAIRRNFSQPWEWEDTDGFFVNHPGHSIQGATYFNAGRVNNFSFYESIFFSLLGSSVWESLCESNHASINDFIVTVTGSLSIGEMFYRLYLEGRSAGIPPFVMALLNPTAVFHEYVTGWKPPNNGRNLYQLQYHIGASYSQIDSTLCNGHRIYSFNGFYPDFGVNIIYGNPFEQDSMIPFNHFELKVSYGTNFYNYMNFVIVSDGYLFSFSPIYTERSMMSTGLSMHWDYFSMGKFCIHDSTINLFSNALDWTLKYKHLLSPNAHISIKYHFGFTFMGVSEYFTPYLDRTLKNYSIGLNSKLMIIAEHNKIGKLEANIFGYIHQTIPGTSQITNGSVHWLITDITYSRQIMEPLSLGITGSFILERGTFENFPDTFKHNKGLKLFVAWNL